MCLESLGEAFISLADDIKEHTGKRGLRGEIGIGFKHYYVFWNIEAKDQLYMTGDPSGYHPRNEE
jgi:hypothetical protein